MFLAVCPCCIASQRCRQGLAFAHINARGVPMCQTVRGFLTLVNFVKPSSAVFNPVNTLLNIQPAKLSVGWHSSADSEVLRN